MNRKHAQKFRNATGVAYQQQMHALADVLSQQTHFILEEAKALLFVYARIDSLGKVDRLRFREMLHTTFNITDDIMLDLMFHAYDRNNDGIVSLHKLPMNCLHLFHWKAGSSLNCAHFLKALLTYKVDQVEWVKGLSIMVRGTPDELIEFCYYVYDMNGDRSLAREELYQCLKGCIIPGFAVEADEIDECERDIVEITMKKLDKDRDGQITFPDFQNAVRDDPLLLQACGPCIPNPKSIAAFMACVTESYRDYTPCYGSYWLDRPRPSTSIKSASAVKIPQRPATVASSASVVA